MPRPSSFVVAAAVVAVGCASSSLQDELDETEARFAGLHHRVDEHEEGVDDAEDRVAELRELVDETVALYAEAERRYLEAQQVYKVAQANAAEATADFEEAAELYRKAAEDYAKITKIILVTAASAAVVEQVCAGSMSTAEYRRQLQKEGINLEGKDIDHIIPKSKGGADHPWNYQVLDSSVNRSLGNDLSVQKFVDAGPTSTVTSLVSTAIATLSCGG